jgi:exosortase/archaeosortase family protein
MGNQLRAPGGGINVMKGCEGTEIMFMLVAAFSAVVMPWRRRLAGLGIGILMVFCLNQVSAVIGPVPQIAPKKHADHRTWHSGMRCCGRPE